MGALLSRQVLEKPLHIVVILGTGRQGRMSEIAADFISTRLAARPLVTIERIDVRAPLQYRDAIVRADGIVIVMPEYNHGYPRSLKTLLDSLYPEYRHKAVAMVGVSSGPWGGVRAVENLTPVLKELGLVVSQFALNIDRVETAFKGDGTPLNPHLGPRAETFVTELLWLAETLRWGRSTLG